MPTRIQMHPTDPGCCVVTHSSLKPMEVRDPVFIDAVVKAGKMRDVEGHYIPGEILEEPESSDPLDGFLSSEEAQSVPSEPFGPEDFIESEPHGQPTE